MASPDRNPELDAFLAQLDDERDREQFVLGRARVLGCGLNAAGAGKVAIEGAMISAARKAGSSPEWFRSVLYLDLSRLAKEIAIEGADGRPFRRRSSDPWPPQIEQSRLARALRLPIGGRLRFLVRRFALDQARVVRAGRLQASRNADLPEVGVSMEARVRAIREAMAAEDSRLGLEAEAGGLNLSSVATRIWSDHFLEERA